MTEKRKRKVEEEIAVPRLLLASLGERVPRDALQRVFVQPPREEGGVQKKKGRSVEGKVDLVNTRDGEEPLIVEIDSEEKGERGEEDR